MKIDYINGLKTDKIFGRSKYQWEIVKRYENIELNIIEYEHIANILKRKFNIKPSKSVAFKKENTKNNAYYYNKVFNFVVDMIKEIFERIDQYSYNWIIKKHVTNENVKHITSQEYAYLLKSIEMKNTIVTCYDLIPWIYDRNRSKMWKNIIKGLKNADIIITISEFSKEELVKHLNYPEKQIKIVYPAVDHSIYCKNRDKRILSKLDIANDQKIVLYVGSETPRQNVPILIKAFSELKKRIPNVKLVKIGESQSSDGREKVLKLINDFNIQDDVIFAGYISEEDMPKWYNAADVLVYPCEYAGFGLPPLEAMACGTPVITSNTTSLPEVVGDAGIMINPHDVDLIADMMYKVLTDSELSEELSKKGIERSKRFNWDNAAKLTQEVYNSFN